MKDKLVDKQYRGILNELKYNKAKLIILVNEFDPLDCNIEEKAREIKELVNKIENSSIKLGMICDFLNEADEFILEV